jgi:hypothetical protein
LGQFLFWIPPGTSLALCFEEKHPACHPKIQPLKLQETRTNKIYLKKIIFLAFYY